VVVHTVERCRQIQETQRGQVAGVKGQKDVSNDLPSTQLSPLNGGHGTVRRLQIWKQTVLRPSHKLPYNEPFKQLRDELVIDRSDLTSAFCSSGVA